ncbi:hypothetical protein [Arvimicrobium flavum]|uniref:hypothetical protein n=1 Tax=Arvimicrobium flavum TaxID=3393320 RepID=UPI00237B6955|nr:hypothetical protein [Mesorhizobium shangrilense]
MPWDATLAFLQPFELLLAVIPLTLPVHRQGLRLAQRYQLSIFDGMIVAAAFSSECSILLFEHMQDGLVIDDRLTIRNPFAY